MILDAEMKSCKALMLVLLVAIPLSYGQEVLCKEGPCCRSGQLLANDTICRPPSNECDAPEVCTGWSDQCPHIDLSIKEGMPCGEEEQDPGTCADGFCWNSVMKAKVKHCDDTCSKINGICSQNGTCVCYEPWKNPPYCNIKGNYHANMRESSDNDFVREMEIIYNITDKRRRRSSGNKHHHNHGNHHHHQPKAVALPRRIEDPPTQDAWTRYTENPLFIPIVVTIVATIILVIFGIWATALYRSELKARKMKDRIKVNRSRRNVSKDTSIIKDPTVTIDVGH